MRHFLLLLVILTLQICNGQSNKISLKDLKFNSIFGTTAKDSTNIYCLLGTGFFRAPRSDNSDELINDWISKNKDAKVVIISTISDGKPNINYCWLVDSNGKTINEYLIENGCFPGGTMIRPKTYKEMSKQERKIYRDEKPKIVVSIDKRIYDEFIEKIKVAENNAKDKKLGIWESK